MHCTYNISVLGEQVSLKLALKQYIWSANFNIIEATVLNALSPALVTAHGTVRAFRTGRSIRILWGQVRSVVRYWGVAVSWRIKWISLFLWMMEIMGLIIPLCCRALIVPHRPCGGLQKCSPSICLSVHHKYFSPQKVLSQKFPSQIL